MGGNNKSPAPRVEGQVMERLIEEWGPKFRSLAKKYKISGKVGADSLYSEFLLLLFQAAKRIEPFTKGFDKYVNFSLRTRIANCMRDYRDQFRYTYKGVVGECLNCGLISSYEDGEEPVCSGCGAKGEIGKDSRDFKWRIARYNLYSGAYGGVAVRGLSPINNLIYDDFIQSVKRKLRGFPDKVLFGYYLDPPEEALRISGNKSPISSRIWGIYMDVSEDTIRRAKTRICIELFKVTGEEKFIDHCSVTLLRRVGFQGSCGCTGKRQV